VKGGRTVPKEVVVYRSIYGATRQYALWIAAHLHCPAFDVRTIRAKDLQEYDTIIYGGPIYVGEVLGAKFLKKNLNTLGHKNLVLFSCGLNDPEDERNQINTEDQLSDILSDELMAHIKVFHLRGAIDYRKLRLLHKIMMAMTKRSIAAQDPSTRTPDDRHLLVSYGIPRDFWKMDATRPILHYVWALKYESLRYDVAP